MATKIKLQSAMDFTVLHVIMIIDHVKSCDKSSRENVHVQRPCDNVHVTMFTWDRHVIDYDHVKSIMAVFYLFLWAVFQAAEQCWFLLIHSFHCVKFWYVMTFCQMFTFSCGLLVTSKICFQESQNDWLFYCASFFFLEWWIYLRGQIFVYLDWPSVW